MECSKFGLKKLPTKMHLKKAVLVKGSCQVGYFIVAFELKIKFSEKATKKFT